MNAISVFRRERGRDNVMYSDTWGHYQPIRGQCVRSLTNHKYPPLQLSWDTKLVTALNMIRVLRASGVKTVRISWVKTSCVWAIPWSHQGEGGLGPGQCHNPSHDLSNGQYSEWDSCKCSGNLASIQIYDSRHIDLRVMTLIRALSSWWMLESVFINGSPPNVT